MRNQVEDNNIKEMIKDLGILENSLLILKQVLVTNRQYVNEECQNIYLTVDDILALILYQLESIEETIPTLEDNVNLSVLNIIQTSLSCILWAQVDFNERKSSKDVIDLIIK